MWRTFQIACPALLSLVAVGCGFLQPPLQGSGVAVTETVEVEVFERMSIAGGATVTWQPGEQASVTVTVDENLLPHLVRESTNGRLDIHFDRNVQIQTPMKVIVTTPKLTEITLVGGGLMALDNLEQESLRIELVGGGGFNATGRCDRLDVAVIGSGTVGTQKLIAQEVQIQITGSGTVDAHADKSCDVTIIGSGEVSVAGAAEPTHEIVGSGTVRRVAAPSSVESSSTKTAAAEPGPGAETSQSVEGPESPGAAAAAESTESTESKESASEPEAAKGPETPEGNQATEGEKTSETSGI